MFGFSPRPLFYEAIVSSWSCRICRTLDFLTGWNRKKFRFSPRPLSYEANTTSWHLAQYAEKVNRAHHCLLWPGYVPVSKGRRVESASLFPTGDLLSWVSYRRSDWLFVDHTGAAGVVLQVSVVIYVYLWWDLSNCQNGVSQSIL